MEKMGYIIYNLSNDKERYCLEESKSPTCFFAKKMSIEKTLFGTEEQ